MWLARALAANAGFVDGAGYVALVRLFTAHQSGNSVGLGVAIGAGDWTDIWRRGLAIGAFAIGVGAGTALVEMERHRHGHRSAALLAGLEVMLLAVALVVGQVASAGHVLSASRTGPYAVLAISLAAAMGVQTVSLRRVGGRTVRTTFVTGVVTNIAENLVVAWNRPPGRRRREMLSFSKLLSSIWLMYLAGGVVGAAAERGWSFAAFALPMAVTAGIAVYDVRAPYQPDLPAQGASE